MVPNLVILLHIEDFGLFYYHEEHDTLNNSISNWGDNEGKQFSPEKEKDLGQWKKLTTVSKISKTPQNKQDLHSRTKFVDDHKGINVLLTEAISGPV
jgi:hypothetical protein